MNLLIKASASVLLYTGGLQLVSNLPPAFENRLYVPIPDAISEIDAVFDYTTQKVYEFSTTFIRNWAPTLAAYTGNNTKLDRVFIGPIIEETVYRTLFQEVLLKRASSALLSLVSPTCASWAVDSKVASMARVFISSTLFTTAHGNLKFPRETRRVLFAKDAIGLFNAGIFFGTFQEITGNTLPSIGFHMLNNFMSVWKSN